MADGINVPACAYIRFLAFGRQPVIADFCGGQSSSGGGALLLQEAEKGSLQFVRRLAACIADLRRGGCVADRAATLKRLAAARGLKVGSRAVNGGCILPQQSESRAMGRGRFSLKGLKSIDPRHELRHAT